MLGFVNLNKAAGMTSHDCVAKVRRLLKIKRVGHGGTLDPAATGVLPIAVGKATRLLNYLPEEKAYRGVVHLGVVTTTDDLAGEVVVRKSALGLSLAEIEAVISGRNAADCDEAAGATRIKRLRDTLGNQMMSELLVKNVARKGYVLAIDKDVIRMI